MKLFIFNPEHDLILAYNRANITLPHVVQEFRQNMGFLPSLWAKDGDCVLVDDIAYALKAVKGVSSLRSDVLFLTRDDLKKLYFSSIEPWGWNEDLVLMLKASGIREDLLPKKETLSLIRELSSRRTSKEALSYLREGITHLTLGESFYTESFSEVNDLLKKYGKIIVKALWSSSGRGLRYVSKYDGIDESTSGWIKRMILEQKGVMVEPYYCKVQDFAMEFFSDAKGGISYQGLSIFDASSGRYLGNIVAGEERKLSLLTKYIKKDVILYVRKRIEEYFSKLFFQRYSGPFGIDMMVVTHPFASGFLLHPCVEVNLRMTMGHVANFIKHTDLDPDVRMRIIHDVNYKLKFEALENNFVKVI